MTNVDAHPRVPPVHGLFETTARVLNAREAELTYIDAYKAKFMEDYNLRRREDMLQEFHRRLHWTPNTEMRHVASYAMAFPHCRHIPLDVSFEFDGGVWVIELDYRDQEPMQAALATLAMNEITSLPVRVDASGEGKGGVSYSEADVEWCRTEIDLLKRFGLWHPDRCLAVIRGETFLSRF